MKGVITLAPAAVLLLLGCEDPDDPAAPQLSTDPVAAVVSSGLKAPSNASAVALSETQIGIGWQDNSQNETGFQVHRSPTGVSGSFTLLVTTGANVTASSDQGLEPGTQYCYQVRAVRVSGPNTTYSAFSNTACATTSGLKAPSNASAVALSETQVDISWQDNSQIETGLELHRSATGVPGTFSLLSTVGANVAAYRDQSLEPGTLYCYQVRAVWVSGNNALYSAFSNTACATTLAPPPPPAAASGTTAVLFSSSIVSISWTDNSSNEDGFRIYRSIDGEVVWDLAGTVGANSESAGAYAVAEQLNCYRVVAFNAGGEAPPSNMACTTPPAGPTNLIATRVDAETLALTWSDNSAVEDGYQVWFVRGDYCCPGGACNAFDPDAGEWMIAELPPNSTRYSYRTTDSSSACLFLGVFVVAKKDGGYSDRSSTVPLP